MSEADAATGRPRGRTARGIARMRELGGGPEHAVMYFKERIYATFTGLAIVLVVTANGNLGSRSRRLRSHPGSAGDHRGRLRVQHHLPPGGASEFPSGREVVILLGVSGSALSTMLTPLILLALVAVDVLTIDAALMASIVVYVVTLGLIGWFAVRRSKIVWWQQVLALAMLMVLGLLVVVLQTLAHSE